MNAYLKPILEKAATEANVPARIEYAWRHAIQPQVNRLAKIKNPSPEVTETLTELRLCLEGTLEIGNLTRTSEADKTRGAGGK